MKKLFIVLFLMPVIGFSQSKSDTLVVPKHVKVIIIDGVKFDVIRNVEVKPVSNSHFLWHYPLHLDTTMGGRIKITN